MAFKTCTAKRAPRKQNTLPGVYLYTKEGLRRADQTEVRLRVTRPLLEKLGWSENQRLNVLVGLDEDDGMLQLEPNPAGIFRLRLSTQSASSFVLASRIIPIPAGINRKVDYQIFNDILIIAYG